MSWLVHVVIMWLVLSKLIGPISITVQPGGSQAVWADQSRAIVFIILLRSKRSSCYHLFIKYVLIGPNCDHLTSSKLIDWSNQYLDQRGVAAVISSLSMSWLVLVVTMWLVPSSLIGPISIWIKEEWLLSSIHQAVKIPELVWKGVCMLNETANNCVLLDQDSGKTHISLYTIFRLSHHLLFVDKNRKKVCKKY